MYQYTSVLNFRSGQRIFWCASTHVGKSFKKKICTETFVNNYKQKQIHQQRDVVGYDTAIFMFQKDRWWESRVRWSLQRCFWAKRVSTQYSFMHIFLSIPKHYDRFQILDGEHSIDIQACLSQKVLNLEFYLHNWQKAETRNDVYQCSDHSALYHHMVHSPECG